MIKVFIKKLSFNDCAQVEHICVTQSQSAFVSPPPGILMQLEAIGDKKINVPFKVESSGKVIGFFTLNFYCPIAAESDPSYFGGEDDCRLESFMISRSYQHRGFGKMTLEAIVAFLKRDFPHIKALKLSVNLKNQMAKAFYIKNGFKDTGKFYHGGPSGPQHIYRMELT